MKFIRMIALLKYIFAYSLIPYLQRVHILIIDNNVELHRWFRKSVFFAYDIYLLLCLDLEFCIIFDRLVCVLGHGKYVVDGMNTI